jgi:hypothetical protein
MFLSSYRCAHDYAIQRSRAGTGRSIAPMRLIRSSQSIHHCSVNLACRRTDQAVGVPCCRNVRSHAVCERLTSYFRGGKSPRRRLSDENSLIDDHEYRNRECCQNGSSGRTNDHEGRSSNGRAAVCTFVSARSTGFAMFTHVSAVCDRVHARWNAAASRNRRRSCGEPRNLSRRVPRLSACSHRRPRQ